MQITKRKRSKRMRQLLPVVAGVVIITGVFFLLRGHFLLHPLILGVQVGSAELTQNPLLNIDGVNTGILTTDSPWGEQIENSFPVSDTGEFLVIARGSELARIVSLKEGKGQVLFHLAVEADNLRLLGRDAVLYSMPALDTQISTIWALDTKGANLIGQLTTDGEYVSLFYDVGTLSPLYAVKEGSIARIVQVKPNGVELEIYQSLSGEALEILNSDLRNYQLWLRDGVRCLRLNTLTKGTSDMECSQVYQGKVRNAFIFLPEDGRYSLQDGGFIKVFNTGDLSEVYTLQADVGEVLLHPSVYKVGVAYIKAALADKGSLGIVPENVNLEIAAISDGTVYKRVAQLPEGSLKDIVLGSDSQVLAVTSDILQGESLYFLKEGTWEEVEIPGCSDNCTYELLQFN